MTFGFELVDSTRGITKQFWPNGEPLPPAQFVRITFVAKESDARSQEYAVRTLDEFKTVFLFVVTHPDLFAEPLKGDGLDDYLSLSDAEL